MTDFETRLQQLISRNWPLDRLKARFSETYEEAIKAIENEQYAGIKNLWRAVWHYESVTQGPEIAYARVEKITDELNPHELFLIREEYYNQTYQLDKLRSICMAAIGARQTLNLAYRTVISLECRSGNLDVAQALVQQAADARLPGFLKQLIRFTHMLGMWALFEKLVEQCAANVEPSDLDLQRWQAIAGWVRASSPRDFPYPHYFVNLKRATGRRTALEERYKPYGGALNFFPAIDGVEMAEDVYAEWCPKGFLHHGGVANLRSQYSVWTKFLTGTDSHVLIFEDDAWPYADMATWGDLKALVAAENPEIVFLNERGAGCWWEADYHTGDKPWVDYLTAISSYTEKMLAPGLDGYLLSRAGAEKLVSNFDEDKIVYNIDWQVAAYALTPEEISAISGEAQRNVLERISTRLQSTNRLRSFALSRPIVCQFAAGHATVNETNRKVYLKGNM